ncbi:MAG: PIN domain-containing protein [Planctomycetaceae bacterium]|nr:PIN domain-containing protein [Planctomycetaceae bacterium]
MKVLCDTSVLVPALWKWHADHAACVTWLLAAVARKIEFFVAAHSLAETYSVVTRLPTKQRVAPADAWRIIEVSILPHAQLIELPSTTYSAVLRDLASRGIGGGIVYDALIAAAAEIGQVDLLVTGNVSHFETVWPQGVGRIVSPKTAIAL